MSPLLDKLAQEYSESIDLIKVDADNEDNFEILAQYDVKSIPTLVALVGDKHVDTIIGIRSEVALRDWIEILIDEYGK